MNLHSASRPGHPSQLGSAGLQPWRVFPTSPPSRTPTGRRFSPPAPQLDRTPPRPSRACSARLSKWALPIFDFHKFQAWRSGVTRVPIPARADPGAVLHHLDLLHCRQKERPGGDAWPQGGMVFTNRGGNPTLRQRRTCYIRARLGRCKCHDRQTHPSILRLFQRRGSRCNPRRNRERHF